MLQFCRCRGGGGGGGSRGLPLVKHLERVSRRGSHGVEEERRILLLLRMRLGPLLLQFFDQVGVRVWQGLAGCAGSASSLRVIRPRLLLVGLAARAAASPFHRLRDRPRKPSPRCVIGLVLAQNVQRRFQGIERR